MASQHTIGGAEASDEERALWMRFVKHRETEIRNQLIERYLPLCRVIAATLFARRGGAEVEFADYMQIATIGMIEAVDRFDPARDTQFATFATPRIRGSVLNSLTDLSEKYAQYSLRKRLEKERLESLQAARPREGGKTLFTELADVAIGLTLSYLLEGSGMILSSQSEGSYRAEFYQGIAHRQLCETIQRLVDALPDSERRVVRYHYYQGLSFTEIAELLSLTKGRISQIHRQALQLLREARANDGSLMLSV